MPVKILLYWLEMKTRPFKKSIDVSNYGQDLDDLIDDLKEKQHGNN